MKRRIIAWLLFGGIPVATVLTIAMRGALSGGVVDIIPAPVKGSVAEGSFVLTREVSLHTAPELQSPARYLAGVLERGTGLGLRPDTAAAPSRNSPSIVLVVDAGLAPEAYKLDVKENRVTISAAKPAGAFYAVQSLLQLAPPEIYGTNAAEGTRAWTFQCAEIKDEPRFQYRGFLLDVARHFFSTEEVKRVVDGIAMHKMNRLQLHLTDDQGWRLEIKAFPKLTEVGAWRKDIGFKLDPRASKAYGPDGSYGGFYTQQEARDLVQFAAEHHVTIVPEIEMPGHAGAALSAYPELSCSGAPVSTSGDAGVFDMIFCPGKEETFAFLEKVLTEVMDVFPGPYIHIGGDEVPKGNWKKCPKCQERIRNEKLKNEEELQTYFISRIGRFIASKGRKMIGWSEMAEGGLPPNSILMDWIGGGLAAAQNGHQVIMSPIKHAYFDYYQSTNRAAEPRAIGGFVPLEQVYAFEPVPAGLNAGQRKLVIGAQANLWTEYIASLRHVNYMTYPRLCAMSEVAWSSPERKDFEGFTERLRTHLKRLDAKGINYRALEMQ